jgi:thiamine kinase-like enzyme
MRNKLERQIIQAKYITTDQKKAMHEMLNKKIFGNNLCHGDLHVSNLIETKDGIKIIDWVDASSGSAAADACRTYLLYKLFREEIAEMYLRLFCNKSLLTKEAIITWLPLIACARLSENSMNENEINKLQKIIGNDIQIGRTE